MKKFAKARAHANIALIKYWGKRDEELALPMNSSISLTIVCFFTETKVILDENLEKDIFYLNGILQDEHNTFKVSKFMDLFRKTAGVRIPAIVDSTNHVPTAAGLASSASGFGALAAAANVAYGLNLNPRELSIYARKGSGSAARSIFGGLVEWKKGINDMDSYAIPIDDASWDIGMVIVIINSKEKQIKSRDAMKLTVETSPFYKGWLGSVDKDLVEIKAAIKNRDFDLMGKIAERNCLKMHATMLGANPPLLYWMPESLMVMQIVRELRRDGVACYFTMDAGPNVKILCRLSESETIKKRLLQTFGDEKIIITGPGPGISILHKGDENI